ncbi:hypothetical protein R2362_03080 [Mycobacteroides chelonae]|nr:hypothetical protein [Mycobacteroides chelonae]
MTLPAYIPAWFEDNFFDIERLLMNMFDQLAPDVSFACWKWNAWIDGEDAGPAVFFYKMPGGAVDWQQQREHHLVQAIAVTQDPDESKVLMSFVRGVLLSLDDGAKVKDHNGDTAQIFETCEKAAPFMMNDEDRADDRVVPATFLVSTNLKSRKRYADMVRAL